MVASKSPKRVATSPQGSPSGAQVLPKSAQEAPKGWPQSPRIALGGHLGSPKKLRSKSAINHEKPFILSKKCNKHTRKLHVGTCLFSAFSEKLRVFHYFKGSKQPRRQVNPQPLAPRRAPSPPNPISHRLQKPSITSNRAGKRAFRNPASGSSK